MPNEHNTASHSDTAPRSYLKRLVRPFDYIARDQRTASVLLLSCTVAALVIANSPYASTYEAVIDTPLGVFLGENGFTMSIRHWVNDGLMALFFFVIGLEIKRELLVGELRKPARAVPVIAAAMGGMIVPALLFVMFNLGEDSLRGWAIPMATDTAFAIGVLSLLGKRVPVGLTAFLLALAIIDDMGAVIVIAMFYSNDIQVAYLAVVAVLLAILMLANHLDIRRPLFYVGGGGLVWFAMYQSGVHSTLAGVLVAITIPARPTRSPSHFIRRSRQLISEFRRRVKNSSHDNPVLAEPEQHKLMERLQKITEEATTPLQLWERTLEHPVSLLVLPLFALVNAGIPLQPSAFTAALADPLALGIIAGLVVGKVIGISMFAYAALLTGKGRLPSGMRPVHTVGLGLLGGMGFTMSIFISGLGFEQDPDALVVAKTGIITASLLAGLAGYTWLGLTSRNSRNRSDS